MPRTLLAKNADLIVTMDAERREFPRHALRETAQRELAHGERR